MTHEHDRLERELAALRPVEPRAELADRIGKQLAADEAASGKPSPGRRPTLRVGARATLSQRERVFRSVPTSVWFAVGGAIAAGVLVAAAIWRGGDRMPPAGMPLDLPQPTLATALDETLPTVWTFRPALDSSRSLDQLLDQHSPRPGAAGNPIQTRGFGSISMELTTRLGEL